MPRGRSSFGHSDVVSRHCRQQPNEKISFLLPSSIESNLQNFYAHAVRPQDVTLIGTVSPPRDLKSLSLTIGCDSETPGLVLSSALQRTKQAYEGKTIKNSTHRSCLKIALARNRIQSFPLRGIHCLQISYVGSAINILTRHWSSLLLMVNFNEF